MKNNLAAAHFHEAWKPLPHVPPDNFTHALLFRLRLFFDLEVLTVYHDLKKAFKETAGRVLEVGCGLQPYRHLLPQTIHMLQDFGMEQKVEYPIFKREIGPVIINRVLCPVGEMNV